MKQDDDIVILSALEWRSFYKLRTIVVKMEKLPPFEMDREPELKALATKMLGEIEYLESAVTIARREEAEDATQKARENIDFDMLVKRRVDEALDNERKRREIEEQKVKKRERVIATEEIGYTKFAKDEISRLEIENEELSEIVKGLEQQIEELRGEGNLTSSQRQVRQIKEAEARGREAGNKEALNRLRKDLDEREDLRKTIVQLEEEIGELKDEIKEQKAQNTSIREETLNKVEKRAYQESKNDTVSELTSTQVYQNIYSNAYDAGRGKKRAKSTLEKAGLVGEAPRHEFWFNAYMDDQIIFFPDRIHADEGNTIMRKARVRVVWRDGQLDE